MNLYVCALYVYVFVFSASVRMYETRKYRKNKSRIDNSTSAL